MGDQLHAEDIAGVLGGLLRIVGDLDATAFAASTGVDLRLNDDATTEIGGDRLGLLGGSGNLAVRDSNPVGAQQLLALEFVDLHRTLVRRSWAKRKGPWKLCTVRQSALSGKTPIVLIAC